MDEQKAENKTEKIKEFGEGACIDGIKVLSVIGQIEGHTELPKDMKATKYEHILPQLVEAEQNSKIRGLLLLLNTMGGDVEAGLAIAEMVSGMSIPTVSLVLGGGHSIGVPLAVSARYSMIAPTASMTVHPVRTSGTFLTVPKTFTYYLKMQERIVRFVAANSNITEEGYRKLLFSTEDMADDTGTVLVGKETVKAGLIDQVGGLREALAALKNMMEKT